MQYAAQKPAGQYRWWVQGHAAALPFPEATFARVLLSLVLHQFQDWAHALAEVARVLQPGRLLIIRTITPEAARQRIPFRFFPTIAEIEATRMPTVADIEASLSGAGFTIMQTEAVERRKALQFQTVLTEFQERPSYRVLRPEELAHGMAALQEEWQRCEGLVIDPRPMNIPRISVPSDRSYPDWCPPPNSAYHPIPSGRSPSNTWPADS